MAVTSGKAVEGSPKRMEIQQQRPRNCQISGFVLNSRFWDVVLQDQVLIKVMKHRHSFFINSSEQPSPDSFSILSGEKGQPSVLKIRKLAAAREWKITIDTDDLDAQV